MYGNKASHKEGLNTAFYVYTHMTSYDCLHLWYQVVEIALSRIPYRSISWIPVPSIRKVRYMHMHCSCTAVLYYAHVTKL